VLTDHLRGNEDVVLRCGVGSLRLAEEAKPLAGDFDNSLRIGRLGRRSIQRGGSGSSGKWLGKFIGTRAMFSLGTLIIRAAVATVVLTIVAEGTASTRITASPATATTPSAVSESAATSLLTTLLSSLGSATGLAGGCVGRGLLYGHLLGGLGGRRGWRLGLLIVAHDKKVFGLKAVRREEMGDRAKG
jgi:hypothetical protein